MIPYIGIKERLQPTDREGGSGNLCLNVGNTLSQEEVSIETSVNLGHSRWLIENKALNEMVIYWPADHVYKHHPNAIPTFWLTLMLVLNLFENEIIILFMLYKNIYSGGFIKNYW